MGIFDYHLWDSVSTWGQAERGNSPFDQIDFHVDLGCGTLKKGRIGIDRYPAPGVNIVMDMDYMILHGMPYGPNRDCSPYSCDEVGEGLPGLPFETDSIKSIISHHFLEHVGDGFIRLVDEIHRVLEPGGVFRAITPLFPSKAAVEDPDHKRYFMEDTWETFCGAANGDHWHESFSVPYTKARFRMEERVMTALNTEEDIWKSAREIRVALVKQ